MARVTRLESGKLVSVESKELSGPMAWKGGVIRRTEAGVRVKSNPVLVCSLEKVTAPPRLRDEFPVKRQSTAIVPDPEKSPIAAPSPLLSIVFPMNEQRINRAVLVSLQIARFVFSMNTVSSIVMLLI